MFELVRQMVSLLISCGNYRENYRCLRIVLQERLMCVRCKGLAIGLVVWVMMQTLGIHNVLAFSLLIDPNTDHIN